MFFRYNYYRERLNNNKEIVNYKEFYKTISNKIEFGGDFTHYDYLVKNRFMDTLTPILNTILRKQPKKLLDIGCGNGINLPISNILPYIDYHGLDYAEKTVATAKKLFCGVTFHLGDAFNMPFKNNSFDMGILSNVLIIYQNEHERKQLLKECNRVINKDGILILVVMNDIKTLKTSIRLSYLLGRLFNDQLPTDFMCVHFSNKDINDLSKKTNFSVVEKYNTSHLYGILECIRYLNLSKFRRNYGKSESEFYEHPQEILKDLQEQAGSLKPLTTLFYYFGNIFPALFSFYTIYVLRKM